MTKKDQDTDVKFIQALAEVLKTNDLAEVRVKREYGADSTLDVRVTRAFAPIQGSVSAIAQPQVLTAPSAINLTAKRPHQFKIPHQKIPLV